MKGNLMTAMLMVLIASLIAVAQTPEHYPPPVPEPVAPTLFNIILYVVIPVLLVVFYIYYRRKKRKERE